MGQSQAAGVDRQAHAAHFNGAAAVIHGFASHPYRSPGSGGCLSWQYPDGSSRPVITGKPSLAGTDRHSQPVQVCAGLLSTAGVTQRTRSLMSGGLLRYAPNLAGRVQRLQHFANRVRRVFRLSPGNRADGRLRASALLGQSHLRVASACQVFKNFLPVHVHHQKADRRYFGSTHSRWSSGRNYCS